MSVLHIPEDLLRRLGPSDRDALTEIATRLYETGRLRFDEAARLAGVDLDTMAEPCAGRKIPVYWYKSEDLESDLDTLKKMTSRRPGWLSRTLRLCGLCISSLN